MQIFIAHPPTLNNPLTYLSADILAAVTAIPVKNTKGFTADDFVVLGNIGFEQAEIVRAHTITAPTTLNSSSNTVFPHNATDRVTQIGFNQIKVYRSTTGINGTYSLLSTIDIDIAHDITMFSDSAPQTNYYYKFAYYNSFTSTEDTQSDAISSIGFLFYSTKTMIDRVLSIFGDARSEFISRDEVRDWLTEIYEKAQRDLAIATKRLNIQTQVIDLEDQTDTYDLDADFLMEKAVKFSTDDGVTYNKIGASMQVDSTGHIYQNNVLCGYTIIGNTIIFDKKSWSNNYKAKIYYVPVPSSLSNQTDTVVAPFTNATAMFIKYGVGMCWLKQKQPDTWEKLTKASIDELANFITYIKKMQNLHPQFVEITGNMRS